MWTRLVALWRNEDWAPRAMRPLAAATLVVNILIVVTGGAVRLTKSGLGCPTWPRCTEDSFIPVDLHIHSVVEFGNRMMTFVLTAVAVATFVAALRYGRRSVVRLAFVLGLVIPAQAVIGGITVLTDLNPWVVAFHLLVSMAIIGGAVLLLVRLTEPDGPVRPLVPGWLRRLVQAVFVATWLVLYLGTVVTGSGPHSGDDDATRNGLDLTTTSHVHAAAVYLLVALTVAATVALHRVRAPQAARSAAHGLLGLLLLQGLVGFVQFFTGLPEVLVALHLLGAALVSAASTRLLLSTRQRTAPAEQPAGPVPARADGGWRS
jgi:cytochrome c oxidase assembly protein subunit 15